MKIFRLGFDRLFKENNLNLKRFKWFFKFLDASGVGAKVKLYEEALQLLVTCSAPLTILVQKLPPALKDSAVESKSAAASKSAASAKSAAPSKSAAASKSDNDFAKDGMKFCEVGVQRMQQITKTMLKLAKEAKTEALQERCKRAYAATLTQNPENPGEWPKKMLEIITNLKPFVPPPPPNAQ